MDLKLATIVALPRRRVVRKMFPGGGILRLTARVSLITKPEWVSRAPNLRLRCWDIQRVAASPSTFSSTRRTAWSCCAPRRVAV